MEHTTIYELLLMWRSSLPVILENKLSMNDIELMGIYEEYTEKKKHTILSERAFNIEFAIGHGMTEKQLNKLVSRFEEQVKI